MDPTSDKAEWDEIKG